MKGTVNLMAWTIAGLNIVALIFGYQFHHERIQSVRTETASYYEQLMSKRERSHQQDLDYQKGQYEQKIQELKLDHQRDLEVQRQQCEREKTQLVDQIGIYEDSLLIERRHNQQLQNEVQRLASRKMPKLNTVSGQIAGPSPKIDLPWNDLLIIGAILFVIFILYFTLRTWISVRNSYGEFV